MCFFKLFIEISIAYAYNVCMSEEKTYNLSPKAENIVKAFFLILLPLILIINVGVVARTLAFPLIYFFGIGYYLILFWPIYRGIYRLVKGHGKKHSSPFVIVGLIFAFIAVEFFLTRKAVCEYSIGQCVNLFNGELSHYYKDKVLNLFAYDTLWTNGLLFNLVGTSFKSFGPIIAVGVICLLVGALIFASPYIIKKIKFENTVKKDQKVQNENLKTVDIDLPQVENKPIEELSVNTDSIEKEPCSINYGFEPEDDIDTSDEFLRKNVSLDDRFEANKSLVSGYNDFTKPMFSQNSSTPVETIASTSSSIEESYQKEDDTIESYYQEANSNNQEEIFNDVIEENNQSLDEKKTEVFTPIDEVQPVQQVATPVQSAQQVAPPVQPVQQQIVENIPPQPAVRKPIVWVQPSSELLNTYETEEAIQANTAIANERVIKINQAFADLKIGAHVDSYTIGPSVTRYNIVYDPNAVSKNIERIVSDISIRLGGVTARFVPIVAGENFSGLEVPNAQITTVGFKEVYDNLPDVKKHPLGVAFGKNISGEVISADFDEFPHLLVAGTTGSGKSIYIHSIICTLIMRMSPEELKVALVDPKKVEMTKYRDMPHLLCPIIQEAKEAKIMLDKLVDEMNNRYSSFIEADDASNIKQYNEWAEENKRLKMPYIVVVLDEYADLIESCKEISTPVVQIAQKARAAGIHLLISTQRPSTNVITGVIKGNLPTHVALMTSSYTDSMTILGEGGAEKLLGKGDMLVQSPLVSRVGVTRLQGCFVQNREIGRVVNYLKEHYETHYDENYLNLEEKAKQAGEQAVASGEVEKEADAAEEERFQSIKEWVMTQEFVSMSKIQRECGVGFNRAGRFFLRLQREGIVSTQQDGSTKGCKVLVNDRFGEE